MDRQIVKGVRLPLALVKKIERIAVNEGSTFSQFLRTAAIKELRAKEQAA